MLFNKQSLKQSVTFNSHRTSLQVL